MGCNPGKIARSEGEREVLIQLPKKLTASGNVLLLLSLMYFIIDVDRVNIATAAAAIKGEFGLSNSPPRA